MRRETRETRETVTVRQFRLDAQAHSRLRILAIERGLRMPELLRSIVEEYVARENRPRGRGKA